MLVAEHLQRQLGAAGIHGFGFHMVTRAAKATADFILGGVTSEVNDADIKAAEVLAELKCQYHQEHGCRCDKRQAIHMSANGDAHRHRPEHIQQVQRAFHCGAVADDGQRTDHAQRNHHVAADGKGDHAGQDTHANQGLGIAPGVDDTAEEPAVDEGDDNAQNQGCRHCGKNGSIVDAAVKLGEEGFFDDVIDAHAEDSFQ